MKHGARFIDLKGQRFGRLTVLSEASMHVRSNGKREARWKCRCDCGNTKIVRSTYLRSRHTKSCGCLDREDRSKRHITHGQAGVSTRTRTYVVWMNMLGRCTNPKASRYAQYGGRGIKVCRRWLKSFENFFSDMGSVPLGKQIGRINNDGDYKPSNCRWEDRKQQGRNKTNTRKLTIDGETMSLPNWAERSGTSPDLIRNRLRLGWSAKRAVFTPTKWN